MRRAVVVLLVTLFASASTTLMLDGPSQVTAFLILPHVILFIFLAAMPSEKALWIMSSAVGALAVFVWTKLVSLGFDGAVTSDADANGLVAFLFPPLFYTAAAVCGMLARATSLAAGFRYMSGKGALVMAAWLLVSIAAPAAFIWAHFR